MYMHGEISETEEQVSWVKKEEDKLILCILVYSLYVSSVYVADQRTN